MRKRDRDRKLMHRALDGEADVSETRILKRKIRKDAGAKQEYDQLRRVMKDTTRIRIEVPPDFRNKVMRGVEEETKRMRPKG